MITRHAELARALGEELGSTTRARRARRLLRALGRQGLPRRAVGRGDPARVPDRPAGRVPRGRAPHGRGRAAVALARRRSGKQFDPTLVEVVCTDAEKVFNDLDDLASWDAVIDGEPGLTRKPVTGECDDALAAVGRFVDLKSPYTLGHSTAVAALAAAAAAELGLADADRRLVHRAGLVAGFGRLGVSNAIWDKPGPLTAGEWERARLHPQYTERMLHRSGALAPIGRVAGQIRERLDGSGYPSGLEGSAIGRPSRILATAEAFQSMCEPRPHRPALSVGRGDRAAARRRAGGAARRFRRRRVLGRRPAGRAPARGPGRPHRPGGRGAPVPWRVGCPNKEIAEAPGDQPQDRGQPHRARLHEDRRHGTGPGPASTPCGTACSRSRSR